MKSFPRIAWRIALAFVIVSLGVIARAADDQADLVFQQAKQSLRDDDVDRAVSLLDEAVRLAPKQAKYQGYRGLARLYQGEFAKGSADLRAAIKLSPGDAGQAYPPPSSTKLSTKALQHGEQQVAAMLRDRPAMAEYKTEAEFLRRWAVRKFAGEDLGSLIDWDPSPPLHSDAEHLAPGDGDNAAILVAADYDSGPEQGKPRSFEELWSGVVYELHNVNYAREFVRLNSEADDGKISKQDFVGGILKYELRAAQQTRAFYVQTFLPWAEKQKYPTDPSLWFCNWWDTPDSVLQSFTDKTAYPWRPYARTHDWATVHRRWRQGYFQKAFKLLKQMENEKGYEDEREAVHAWIKQCREQINKKHHGGTEGTGGTENIKKKRVKSEE
jgi:tetratricopeptide (TPR) repeat protein